MTLDRTYKPRPGRTGLPVVDVTCTDPSCRLEFPSGAEKSTDCPGCGRHLTVHRSADTGRESARVAVRRASAAARQQLISSAVMRQSLPAPGRQPTGVPPVPAAVPVLVGDDDDDDDGLTYWPIGGQLVVAEQLADGTWVPAPARLPPAAPVRSIPAPARQPARRLTAEDVLAVLGLKVDFMTRPGTCPVVEGYRPCGAEGGFRDKVVGVDHWFCAPHWYRMGKIFNSGG